MWRKLIATRATWVPLPLRFALAAVFIGQGGGKVFGWFGGAGLTAFTAGTTPFSFMRPPWLWLGAAAFAEFTGGLLVLLGLTTRVGAFLILCVMLTVIFGFQWGAFFLPRGIEYTLTLSAAAIALLIAGGGQASMDRLLMDARDRRR